AHPVAPPARCCAAESSAFVARENDTFASSGEAEVKSWVMSLTPFAAECAESHPVVAWSRRRIAPVPARRVVLADESTIFVGAPLLNSPAVVRPSDRACGVR